MDVQKIKRLNYSKGGKYKKTPEQIEASRKSMISLVLSMKAFTPEANEKRRKTLIKQGRRPTHPFPKGNQLGRLSKNRKISEEQRNLMSIKKIGKKVHSEAHKKELSEQMKKDNPMKIPEIQKKQKAAELNTRKINEYRHPELGRKRAEHLLPYIEKNKDKLIPFVKGNAPWNKGKKVVLNPEIQKMANEKRRKANLTNEKVIATQFCTNTLITPSLEKDICEMYNHGESMDKIAKKFRAGRNQTIRKILVKNGIEIRKNTDSIYHLENNFKKCKEVQDETNNNTTAPVAISN